MLLSLATIATVAIPAAITLSVGDNMDRSELIKHLVLTQYTRNDVALERSTFRARGDIVEIMTSKVSAPRLDWLNFVVTKQATSKIKQK